MYVVLTQWLVPNILQWATNMQQYKNQVENQKERARFDKAKVWSLCSPPWVSQKVSVVAGACESQEDARD